MSEMLPQQIEQELMELPHKLWQFGKECISAETAWRMAEEQAESGFQREFLNLKAANKEKTIKELEAEAHIITESLRLRAIELEAVFKAARLKAECCRDKLGALQSLVKLKVSEIQSMNA